tara:strand:+ start:96 stop:287 length:192 start_codon:yes stop_codon:yes gene_type:complete
MLYQVQVNWVARGTWDMEVEAEDKDEACDIAADKDINLSGRVGYRDDGFDIGYEDVEDVKLLS